MRILLCSEQPPFPPFTGSRLVLRALVRALGDRHELRLLSFGPADGDHDGLSMRLLPRTEERGRDVVRHVLRAFRTGRPMRYDDIADQLRAPLQQEMKTFDPDVVHLMTGGLATLGAQLADRPAVLVALDAAHLNVQDQAHESGLLRRLLLLGEARRVRRFEAAEYPHFPRVVVVSEVDRAALHTVAPQLTIDVIPNGVDTDHFAPSPLNERRRVIVFHGVMNFAPNVGAAEYLARKVWPRVRAVRQDAELAIVGRAPARRVRSLEALDGVTVTGEVADVGPWLSGSRIYACPMLTATGIKNKLLEAMASGMACVATPLALSGISAVAGHDLLVAQGQDELAAAIVRLLDDDELARRLGRAARAYVRAEHDWDAVARAYERVYEAAVRSRREGAALRG